MRRSPLYPLFSVLVFIILETISVLLVYNRGIVQRNSVLTAVGEVSFFLSEKWSGLLSWVSLRKENDALTEENAALLRSNISLQEQLTRYRAEEDSLLVPDDFFVIPSAVISNSTGRQHNHLILNRGKEDGVTAGMGVLTSSGIIGIVESTSEHYSRVASMLDIDSKFSVILKKNGTFGSLSWDGVNSECVRVYDMPLHTVLSVGDTLISSGYSAVFPYGIPIGTISEVFVNDGINYELQVSLFENFNALRYVYVVGQYQQEELTALMKEDK